MEDFELDFEGGQDELLSAAEQAEDKVKSVLKKVSKWKSAAIIGGLILISMVLPLASFNFVNPFSVEFLVNAVYYVILATVCYYIFAPVSAKAERSENEGYKTARSNWLKLSKEIRTEGLMGAFYNFCVTRREEEREELKSLYIEAAGIPREIYDEQYAKLTKKQLKERKKSGEITGTQYKHLCSANDEIEVLPINASLILSGLNLSNINDVGRGKKGINWLAILKPATLILTMAIRGMIHVMGSTDVGFLDYITQIMTTVSIILSWSFAGYRFGIAQVRDEEQLMKGRSEFMAMFLERHKKGPALVGGTGSQAIINDVI